MAGYIIAELQGTDPKIFEEYRGLVSPTIEKYGGQYVVRGGESEKIEGDWTPGRLVIIRFDSVDKAKEWYYSDDYKGPMGLRHKSATTNLVIVEGV